MGLFSWLTNPVASVIGGGVSAIGSVASTAMNNKAAAKAQQQQFAHEKEMNEIQNQQNKENWQYQFDTTNEYNDPSAQRERLEKAGINPALAASGGSLNSGASSASPSFGSPIGSSQSAIPARFDGIADAFNVINKSLMQAATLEKASAEINKTKKETERIDTLLPDESSKLSFDSKLAQYTSELQKKYNEDYESTRHWKVEAQNAQNENTWQRASTETSYAAANAYHNAQKLEAEARLSKLQETIETMPINHQGKQMALGLVRILSAIENTQANTEQVQALAQQARDYCYLLKKQAQLTGSQIHRSEKTNQMIDTGLDTIWSNKVSTPSQVMDAVENSLMLINGGSSSSSYGGNLSVGNAAMHVSGGANTSSSKTIGAQR